MKGTDTLVDTAAQAEIQLWKYDPTILDKSGIVDSLSLAMTLKDKPDERVESAVEEMLNDIWRD